MELLESQEKLQELLSTNPAYLKAMKEKHPSWLSIDIAPMSQQVVKTYKINPEAVSSWKNGLKDSFSILPKGKPVSDSIVKEIAKESAFLNNRTVQGLFTGLVMSLPEEDRKLVFAAPSNEKFDLLSKKLPSKIDSTFKAQQYGIALNPSKEEVLDLLVKIQKSEQNLRKFTELSFALQDGNGVITNRGLEHLDSLGPEDLQALTDPDFIDPRLKALTEQVSKENIYLNKNVSASVKKHLQGFASQIESSEEVLGKGIRLDEMPPSLGIFRGCTGGDCSTSMSFAYPNSPNEKIFYIYGSNNELKGYVTGSFVEANGKPSFRVITIAGPRVSTGDADMIFEGLLKIKSKLNVEQIVLPVKEKIAGLINFTPIKAAYDSAIAGKKPVPVKYTDAEFRKVIEDYRVTYNSAGYDKMENNKQGVILEGKSGFQVEVKTSEKMFKPKSTSLAAMQRTVFEFGADLIKSGRSNQVSRVFEAADIPSSKMNQLSELVMNKKGLNLKDYKTAVKAFFNYTDSEIESKFPMYFEGALNSPDIHLLDSDPQYLNFLLKRLEKNPDDTTERISSASLIKNLLKQGAHAELIVSNNIFSNEPIAKEFTKEIREIYNLQKANPAYSKNFLRNPEIMFELKDLLPETLKTSTSRWSANFITIFFSRPESENMQDLFKLALKRIQPVDMGSSIAVLLAKPHLGNMEDVIWMLLKKNDQNFTRKMLVNGVFSGKHIKASDEMLEWIFVNGEPRTFEVLYNTIESLPAADQDRILKRIIKKANPYQLEDIAGKFFNRAEKMDGKFESLKLLVKRKERMAEHVLVRELLLQGNFKGKEEIIEMLVANNHEDTLRNIAVEIFGQKSSYKYGNAIRSYIERADPYNLERLALYFFAKPHSKDNADELKLLIAKADEGLLKTIKEKVLTLPHWKNDKAEFLNKNIPTREIAAEPKIKKVVNYKNISSELKAEDIVKTDKGKVLTIVSFVDQGKRGKVYQVKDENGSLFALKVAKDTDPKTIESMSKEAEKAALYEKYKIPHAQIHESNSVYALKDWIEGTRADEFVKNWRGQGTPEDAPEMKDLKKLIRKTAKDGAYIGDLNLKNLIWNGKKWIVIDSGSISEGLSKEESIERFMEKIPRRWSKQDGEVCPTLFKSIVKSLK